MKLIMKCTTTTTIITTITTTITTIIAIIITIIILLLCLLVLLSVLLLFFILYYHHYHQYIRKDMMKLMKDFMVDLEQKRVASEIRDDERMKKFEKDDDERMKKFEERMVQTINESVVNAVAISKVDEDGIQLIISSININTNIISEGQQLLNRLFSSWYIFRYVSLFFDIKEKQN